MKFCSETSGKSDDMLACAKANQSRYSDVCKKELQARAAAGFSTGKVGNSLR
jgi:hypothetical protein